MVALDVGIAGGHEPFVEHVDDGTRTRQLGGDDEVEPGVAQGSGDVERRRQSTERRGRRLIAGAPPRGQIIDGHEPPPSARRHRPVVAAEPDRDVLDVGGVETPSGPHSVGNVAVVEHLRSREHASR